MRANKLIKLAKECIRLMAFIVFDFVLFLWDAIVWYNEDSALSGWMAIAMFIIGCFEIFFFKNTWKEFYSLCCEVKD